MKRLLIAVAVVAVTAAGGAVAQPGHPRQNEHHDRQDQRHDQRNDRHDERSDHRDDRKDERREQRAEHRYRVSPYRAPQGYQSRQWRYGERLPASYRSRAYVVDYRTYRLRAPPVGYQYVRVGNDVVLAANSTGLITSVILQLFQTR